MSFYIKDLKIEGKVILAPMAGVTSFSYRKFNRKFFNGLTYTEMISDCGLNYHNERTFDMCYQDGKDHPLALQLFGGSKETLLKAIDELESRFDYDILDLNLACPVPKVTKSNGGSSWLKDLDLLKDMVSAVVKKSKKPVTCKIRLGFNEINVLEIAKTLEDCGVSFLCIHCRTKKELYSGLPHYDALKDLKNVISIPFAVSGNIFTLEDAIKAYEITKCDAIAVARGGIGHPLLIKNIENYFAGVNEFYEENKIDQVNYLKEYATLLKEEIGTERAASVLKGIAPKFLINFADSKPYRIEIVQSIKKVEDMFQILNKYLKETSN